MSSFNFFIINIFYQKTTCQSKHNNNIEKIITAMVLQLKQKYAIKMPT